MDVRTILPRTLLVSVILALSPASSATAGCDYEHPRKAKLFQADFVQAFVSCGNPGGNTPNTTSASGVPGCTPPETFNERAGSPINGWVWDEKRSRGNIQLREIQGVFGGNSRSLRVKMRLRNILDGNGDPANGSGTLFTLSRTTLEDTVVSAPGMGTDMTIIDFPAPFAFSMVNGNANITIPPISCLIGCPDPLPGCTSIEVMNMQVLDPNGNVFAVPGVFFKDLPN